MRGLLMIGYRSNANLISDKKRFSFRISCVSTNVCMHYLDTNEIYGEKVRWELYKNAVYCFEQTLGATLPKTAAVRPPKFV